MICKHVKVKPWPYKYTDTIDVLHASVLFSGVMSFSLKVLKLIKFVYFYGVW